MMVSRGQNVRGANRREAIGAPDTIYTNGKFLKVDPMFGVASAVAVRDVYDRFLRPRASDRERLFVGRAVIVLATIVAVAIVIADEAHLKRTGQQYDFMRHISWRWPRNVAVSGGCSVVGGRRLDDAHSICCGRCIDLRNASGAHFASWRMQ